jgi:hypothetical protein
VVGVGSRAPFLGPFETPAGVIQPTGTKLDFPGTDFWYVREGKIQEFKRHVGMNIMFAQLGVQPDFASASAASAADQPLARVTEPAVQDHHLVDQLLGPIALGERSVEIADVGLWCGHE